MFAARGVEEIEQQDIRVNGLALGDGAGPRLPLIEPARGIGAACHRADRRLPLPPAGTETVRGIHCLRGPVRAGGWRADALPGRRWIATDDFGLVKVARDAARAPRANRVFRSGGRLHESRRPVGAARVAAESDLCARPTGRRSSVITVERTDINPPDFDSRRAVAPRLATRDGARHAAGLSLYPAGARTAPRIGSADRTGSGGAGAARAHDGLRNDRRSRISRPLPFAGLSYVDFDLFASALSSTGSSAGRSASWRSQYRPWLAAAGRSQGARSPSPHHSTIDRSTAGSSGMTRTSANVRRRPRSRCCALTPRVTLKVVHELDYTAYVRADTTASQFVAPTLRLSTRRASRDRRPASWLDGEPGLRGRQAALDAVGITGWATTTRPSIAIFNVSARRSPAPPSAT